jgi:hypothetical protein
MSAFIVLLALDVNDRVNEWGHQALLQARAAIARQTLMSRINSWTKQQDELLLRLYPTYRPACIAIFLGRTKGAVMTRHWFLRRQRKQLRSWTASQSCRRGCLVRL